MKDIEERFELMYEFENNIQLYQYRFKDTGIPMWMYIRSFVITDVRDEKMNYQAQKSYKKGEAVKKGIIERYITRNPFLSRRKEILFAFWGYDALRNCEDDLVYDPLIMPYLRMFPDKVVTLMDGVISNRYQMKCIHPNWKMDDIFINILKCVKYLKGNRDICLEDRDNISALITFLSQNCPLKISNSLRKKISYMLKEFAEISQSMIKIFEIYLGVLRPKVAIICCGSRPNIFRTSMILACRNKKIVTAELQHGVISRYYPWAQYSDFIVNNNEFSVIFPDYFLLFGEYWKRLVKTSQRCDVIGYAKPIAKDVASNNNNILFCAGTDFDKYRCFLDRLLLRLDAGTTIYFRFHPIYSTDKQRDMFRKYLKYPNFAFANNGELSDYMEKCRYVIADGSTVSYEALFIGRIVFVFRGNRSVVHGVNELIGVNLFDNVDDFIVLWNKRDKLESRCHKEFFELDYKHNYIRFLKKCGVDISVK